MQRQRLKRDACGAQPQRRCCLAGQALLGVVGKHDCVPSSSEVAVGKQPRIRDAEAIGELAHGTHAALPLSVSSSSSGLEYLCSPMAIGLPICCS